MYRVHLTADFETEAEVEAALSDLNEVVAKRNGDLQDDEVEDLDAEV